jgi:hypothetical protein
MAQQEVFYEVLSGTKKLPVYDVDAHNKLATARTDLNALSGKVDTHIDDTDRHVTTADKANWDKVTEKVDTTVFEQYKTSAETELDKKVNKTDFNEYKTSAGNELAKKLNTETFETYTATADAAAYSAGANIDITNHVVSGKSWQDEIDTAKEAASAAAVANVEGKFGYDGDGNIITYNESAFYTPDMTQYYTKEEANAAFLSANALDSYSGNWQSAAVAVETSADTWNSVTAKVDETDFEEYKTSAHQEFVDVSAWADSAFQPAGDYVSASDLADYYTKTEVDDLVEPFTTSAEVEEMVNELAEDVQEALSGLYNTEVVAGYGIQVEEDVDPDTGDKTYTISTDPLVLNYGLFNTNQTITYVSPSTVLGFATNGDIQGENISLDTTTHQISLEPGSYHIDIQVNANIDGTNCALTNAYYDGILTASPQPIRTVRMSIDGSYVHTETFTLSYDIKIEEASTLTFTMSGLPSGCQCSATLNIHEILTLEAAAEAISNNYTAGDGMRLENKSFSVNQGDGLEITQDNKLQVKLGNGLSFTDDHGIQAISIDPEGDVAEVVETVKELEDAIATKITTNYPPAMITDSHAQVMAGTQYTPGNGGCLYGTLFNTPITHPVAIDKTFLGIYAFNGGIKAILGVYEYQPDFERKDQGGAVTGFGRTVPLCDTGIITISQGFHEYPVKHLNNTIGGANPETTPELKTNCMYYATIYLGYASTAGANDLQVGCAAGYRPQYGDIKPAMSMANVNNIKANIDVTSHSAYTEDLSFNDMGFNWQYTAYPARESSTTSTYFEANESPRMYMQIRNIK